MSRKILLALSLCASAFAQSFTGFSTGNIVVSRSVYSGSAATLAAGQPLPPVCPSTAKCGTAKATDSGAYIRHQHKQRLQQQPRRWQLRRDVPAFSRPDDAHRHAGQHASYTHDSGHHQL